MSISEERGAWDAADPQETEDRSFAETEPVDPERPQRAPPNHAAAPVSRSTETSDGQDYLRQLERYAAEVHGFVTRRVRNFADAEDIAQQTLLLAHSKLNTFRNGNFRAWLLSIARNLIVDHFRAQHRRQLVEVTGAALTETEPALRTPHEAVPEACESRDRLRCYLCLTGQLPTEQQVAVLLADVHGYRDKESAVLLDVSVASFKLLLHSARMRMHQVSSGSCAVAEAPDAPGGATGTGGANGHDRQHGGNGHANRRVPLLGNETTTLDGGGNGRGSEAGRGAQVATPGAGLPCPDCPLGVACPRGGTGPDGECRLGLRCGRRLPALHVLRQRLLQGLGPARRT